MPKNIVVCCDGTNGEFRLHNTNVVRLFELLERDGRQQLAFYDPGLGTMGAPGTWTKIDRVVTRVLGLAFAFGLRERIGCVYGHLMANYEPGDRVFLFGFSRGAYTVRAVAALLHMFGLLPRGNEQLVPYVTEMFRRPHDEVVNLAKAFKPQFSVDCPVHFVGVWDTVSSVGWVTSPISLPFTAHNPSIAFGRHAVSIDERRCFFKENLWHEPDGVQDLKQVWFAGCHGDVGGGEPQGGEGLANDAFWWMVDEATSKGLRCDAARLAQAKADPTYRADPLGTLHESLAGIWAATEWLPNHYWDMSKDPPVHSWRIPRGRRRYIPPGSVIHASVEKRMQAQSYAPPNLPANHTVEGGVSVSTQDSVHA